MERFTKIMADLESKKRRAVEIKNYDEAEKIKVKSMNKHIYMSLRYNIIG
jgi:hypothetical protein